MSLTLSIPLWLLWLTSFMLVELVVGVVGGNVAAVVVIGGVGAVGICIIVNMLSIFQWPLLRSLLLLLLSSLFLQLLLSFSCWIVVVVAVAVAAIFGPRSLFSSTCTSFHPLRSLGCRKASKNESDVMSRELFSSVLCTKLKRSPLLQFFVEVSFISPSSTFYFVDCWAAKSYFFSFLSQSN